MRTKGPAVVAFLATLLAIGAWLPFLRSVLMPDEAGFLIIAEQFGPGRSLYGDYWVDRPPLIIWMYTLVVPFATVGHVPDGATVPAIKLFGAVIATVSVLLAFLLARRAAPDHRWTHYAAPVLTLALVSSPLLGMPSTNGTLLALPFVLASLALLIPAVVEPHRGRAPMAAFAAGACAMSAVMVKQNFIDVYVFALVAFIVLSVRREQSLRILLGFVAGSFVALVVIIASAVLRGSSLTDLWEAIVTFRFHASALIGSEFSDSRVERMTTLAAAFVISGAAALLALTAPMVLGRRGRGHPQIGLLAAPAVAMAVWEIVAVVLGGSYWLHYLTGLVPGLVLLVILAGSLERRRSLLTIGVVLATVANAAAWGYRVTDPPQAREDARVAAYLREHSKPTDSLVVGFGHPNVYVDAEMRGQYPYMWSLPTRVNDPGLHQARRVLSGPRAPRWVVVHEDTPTFWDEEARKTRRHVEENYVEREVIGGWHVWERRPPTTGP